tara:strand:+ start:2442 stop:3242 length:801 start_codon:yes stop_codon:yes gene_type:complete
VRYEVVSGEEYPVYSRKEADELGLSYNHPFDVSEGEYGVSSDDEVSICLKKSQMKGGTFKVKYPWGPSFVRSGKDDIKSTGRINNYTESGKNNRGKFIAGSDNFKKLAHLMAQPGMTKKASIQMVFGHLPDNKRYSLNKTMRMEVFRNMVNDELDKIVEQFPIGKMDTARALAAVLDRAMDWDGDKMGKGGDAKIAVSVLDKLMDMNDMKSRGKIITTHQIEASTVEHTLADIQEKKKLFKATQTEEIHGLEQTTEKKEESEQKET